MTDRAPRTADEQLSLGNDARADAHAEAERQQIAAARHCAEMIFGGRRCRLCGHGIHTDAVAIAEDCCNRYVLVPRQTEVSARDDHAVLKVHIARDRDADAVQPLPLNARFAQGGVHRVEQERHEWLLAVIVRRLDLVHINCVECQIADDRARKARADVQPDIIGSVAVDAQRNHGTSAPLRLFAPCKHIAAAEKRVDALAHRAPGDAGRFLNILFGRIALSVADRVHDLYGNAHNSSFMCSRTVYIGRNRCAG